ncbi:MAG: universal stress protein [Bacteroidetes bacterium]|nr:MAG: universal stress protein [Bacteroidota bacterium]
MNPGVAYSFLVPVDFTNRSVHAIQYAADILKEHKGAIHLLHVVDDRTQPSEASLEATKAKVIQLAEEQQEKLNVKIIPNLVTGNIFTSIGEAAKKFGVQLIIMGTHGMHGIQFIIGSFAARVILGSPVPVLLTNGTKQYSGFKNIILPFDNSIKIDNLLAKTIELGTAFGSTIHLFSQKQEQSLLKKLSTNLTLQKTKKRIRKAGLVCHYVSLETYQYNNAESILKYAENIDADLIMVSTQNQTNSKEYIIVESCIKLMEKTTTPLFFLNPALK